MKRSVESNAAATRVYEALFSGASYEAKSPKFQPHVDVMSWIFRTAMVDRIEAAILNEPDPLTSSIGKNNGRALKVPGVIT